MGEFRLKDSITMFYREENLKCASEGHYWIYWGAIHHSYFKTVKNVVANKTFHMTLIQMYLNYLNCVLYTVSTCLVKSNKQVNVENISIRNIF